MACAVCAPHPALRLALAALAAPGFLRATATATVNFARPVRVPGIDTWGYDDTTTPPTSPYAAYDVITAPEELFVVVEAGHVRVPAHAARRRR
jgi:hypothetical protein